MEFKIENNRVFLENENGKMIGEITFPKIFENVVNINHTFVDESLRGQGIASKLMKKAVMKIREENLKAYPTCFFAEEWLKNHEDFSDIYLEKLP